MSELRVNAEEEIVHTHLLLNLEMQIMQIGQYIADLLVLKILK